MSAELRILRAVHLKGRAFVADVPTATGLTRSDALQRIRSMMLVGHVSRVGDRIKLTRVGRLELIGLASRGRSGECLPVITGC